MIAFTIFAQSVPPAKRAQSAPESGSAKPSWGPADACDVQCAAKQLVKSLSINCVDTTYVTPAFIGSNSHSGDRTQIEAVKDLAVRPVPWAINDADRLNKIDWIGDLVLTATARRPASEMRWNQTRTVRHQTAEESRTRQADIEGRCSKCVSVANEFEAIGAYREAGTWHYFESKSDLDRSLMYVEAVGIYPVAPHMGREIDLGAVVAAKSSCSSIVGSTESIELQRKAAEQKAEDDRATAEAARKAAEAKALADAEAARKAEVEREQHRKDLQAVSVRMKEPQTELEKTTKADGFWTDPSTGLTWAAKSIYTGAFRACKDIGGGTDWRVADLSELETLDDPANSHDFIYNSGVIGQYHIAGGIMLSDSVIWTSFVGLPQTGPLGDRVSSANLKKTDYRDEVWVFDFRTGEPSLKEAGNGGSVLCVRGTAKLNGIATPSVLSQVAPEYSTLARSLRVAGTVLISMTVDSLGQPRDLRVIRGLGSGLDEKAVEAVQKWRYKPGMRNGVPVNTKVFVTINFSLR